MAKFDPRKLTEQAIEVMQRSAAEPRDDGKASPRVGAVPWKPDGTVETARRGEPRDGDHPEYTLTAPPDSNPDKAPIPGLIPAYSWPIPEEMLSTQRKMKP